MLRFATDIDVRYNLELTTRERGKLVDYRLVHNIFLDLGREWLAQLVSYQSLSPDVPFRNDRVRYMGFGIGGNRQIALGTANSPPVSPPYSGTNAQSDTDPLITTMERPVRITGSTAAYPGVAGDQWVGPIGSADPLTIPTQVTYRRLFTQTEVSYGPYTSVPISEVGLFTSNADPNNHQNVMVAYDTFDTLSKTTAFELEVVWTVRF
jgi:hypothetical protein